MTFMKNLNEKQTNLQLQDDFLKYLLQKIFGYNINIISRKRLPSSKLSNVEIVDIGYLHTKVSCVVKVLNPIWRDEPKFHQEANKLAPSFVPNFYAEFSTDNNIIYIQERIETRREWTKVDVLFVIKALLEFYKVSRNTSSLISQPEWVIPLSVNTKQNVKCLATKIAFNLGENKLNTITEICQFVHEVIEKTNSYQSNFLVHNDLHADQFLLEKNGDLKLSDWGFLMKGHPIIDLVSIIRDEPDGRNTPILPFREYFLEEFSLYARNVLGYHIHDEDICLWRKWQCIRDILWFNERKRRGVEFDSPLELWCYESAMEFQYLCITQPRDAWRGNKTLWLSK